MLVPNLWSPSIIFSYRMTFDIYSISKSFISFLVFPSTILLSFSITLFSVNGYFFVDLVYIYLPTAVGNWQTTTIYMI